MSRQQQITHLLHATRCASRQQHNIRQQTGRLLLIKSRLEHHTALHHVQVEKHIRKNKLQLTFTDQLGRAVHVGQDEEGDIASKAEAKKLAFYLFWNMRASLSRSA